MKKMFFALCIVFLVACATPSPQTQKYKEASFPVFELPIPQNDAEQNYLGISGSGKFKITQIKSPVIIIEVLCTDCPNCRIAASSVNEVYEEIQARPDLKDKIKIIGIMQDNNINEVDSYRARYNVPFPLFLDPGGSISDRLGVQDIPTFIGIKNNDDGTTEQFYFQSGAFRLWSENRFLKKIIKLSKLEIGEE